MYNKETKNRPLCGNPQIVEYLASCILSDKQYLYLSVRCNVCKIHNTCAAYVALVKRGADNEIQM